MVFRADFGLLTKRLELDLGHIRVVPKADCESTVARFMSEVHKDGFFYPSSTEEIVMSGGPNVTPKEVIPYTKRPAHLFCLPATHSIQIVNPSSADPLRGDAAFLVHLIAYLYGTRLQIDGWQFDGKIPVKDPTHHAWISKKALERFIPRAYHEWCCQPPERQLRLVNILYVHTKASSYEWPWERFLIEYLVTDAMYDYCQRTLLTCTVSHEERIREMCGRLGVWCPDTAPVGEIVQIRNSLFHEALWEEDTPGYKISSNTYYRIFELRALNQRIIAAILGGATPYTSIPWTEWRSQVEFV